MEPEWTKKNISNDAVCSYYYVLFVIAAVAAVASLIMMFIIPFMKGIGPGLKTIQIITLLIQGSLAVIATLAAYLMCDRALKPASLLGHSRA
jgi:hypothetical protein